MTDIDNELEPARGDVVTIEDEAPNHGRLEAERAKIWQREMCATCGREETVRPGTKLPFTCEACEMYERGEQSARASAQAEIEQLRTDLHITLRERDDAREIAQNTASKLAEVACRIPDAIGESRDLRAQLEDARAEIERINAERVKLTEIVGYYARSNVPRLLGIAEDQITAVRELLKATETWRACDVDPSRGPGCGCREAMADAADEWVDLGRPLAEPVFVCTGCSRAVPWSAGADDEGPELCDDCWAAKRKAAP